MCLSGIPPFNGFWSKDLIILAALEHHMYPILILIILASIFTVAYSFRWLGLVFFGKYRGEESGHLHESPFVMTIPLVILAAFACVSGFLEEPFMHYFGFEHLAGLELIPLLLTVIILIIGFVPAYIIYFRKSVASDRFRSGTMATFHKILSEGYYFDKVYYAIFLNGFPKFCNQIYNWIDLKIIDKFNYAVADVAKQISQNFRPSHTGVLSANMSGILAGLVGFLILILIMLG
jgi:NADH-quinone oxidoreductase subunit L